MTESDREKILLGLSRLIDRTRLFYLDEEAVCCHQAADTGWTDPDDHDDACDIGMAIRHVHATLPVDQPEPEDPRGKNLFPGEVAYQCSASSGPECVVEAQAVVDHWKRFHIAGVLGKIVQNVIDHVCTLTAENERLRGHCEQQHDTIAELMRQRNKSQPEPEQTHVMPMHVVADGGGDIRIPNSELLGLAKKNPPPPKFFEGEEERPWAEPTERVEPQCVVEGRTLIGNWCGLEQLAEGDEVVSVIRQFLAHVREQAAKIERWQAVARTYDHAEAETQDAETDDDTVEVRLVEHIEAFANAMASLPHGHPLPGAIGRALERCQREASGNDLPTSPHDGRI